MSLIEKIALKPCPFCGGGGEVYHAFPKMEEYQWALSVDHEDDCVLAHTDGAMPCFNTPQEAIAAWNNRAALTAIMGEGDGVQEVDVACEHAIQAAIFSSAIVPGSLAARHRSTAAAAERARRDKVAAAMREEADRLSASGDMAFTLRKWADAIERGEV